MLEPRHDSYYHESFARPFLGSWPGGFAKWLGEVLAQKIYSLVSASGCELACAEHTMPLPLR